MDIESLEEVVQMYGTIDNGVIRVKRGDERRWNNAQFWNAANPLLQDWDYGFIIEA